MTRETVEQMLDLNVIFAQTESGATDDSKAIFEAYHDQVGAPKIVVLAYVTEPGWEFLTYVVGEGNQAICLDGFAWGFGGSGPHGLKWLLEQIGFQPLSQSPPAHEEGVWIVHENGDVVAYTRPRS